MPFTNPFNNYYRSVLNPAIIAAGFTPVRADEIYGTTPIIDDVINEIRGSSALVADVTGKNPNVNYELGIAHTLQKPVVIISQTIDDIPFDYRHYRAYVYNTAEVDWAAALADKITKTLRRIKLNPPSFPKERRATVSHLELNKVFMTRPGIKNFLDLLQAAESGSEIMFLGMAMTTLSDVRIQDALENKLREGCKARLLSLYPKSHIVKQKALDEGRKPMELKKDLLSIDEHHRNFIKYRLDGLVDRIEMGHYDEPLKYFLFITSAALIAGFYLPGARCAFLPHIQIDQRENSAYTAFQEYFNSLWERRIELRETKTDTLEEDSLST
jgi:hypothetical protein